MTFFISNIRDAGNILGKVSFETVKLWRRHLKHRLQQLQVWQSVFAPNHAKEFRDQCSTSLTFDSVPHAMDLGLQGQCHQKNASPRMGTKPLWDMWVYKNTCSDGAVPESWFRVYKTIFSSVLGYWSVTIGYSRWSKVLTNKDWAASQASSCNVTPASLHKSLHQALLTLLSACFAHACLVMTDVDLKW